MVTHSSFRPCCFSDTCDVRCARKKTEKRFRKTIRTLRKTVSRDQFRIRVSGTDHEVARKALKPSEPQQSCGAGQTHPGNRCGELRGNWERSISCVSLLCSALVSSEVEILGITSSTNGLDITSVAFKTTLNIQCNAVFLSLCTSHFSLVPRKRLLRI